mgnify:CR=1 FL=1
MMELPEDPTLDEIRAALAPALPAQAAFDGWTPAAVALAAAQAGVDADIARIAFKGGGVAMIDAWFRSIDVRMAAAFTPDQLAAMKIRGRITALVWARIGIAAPYVMVRTWLAPKSPMLFHRTWV